MKTTAALVAHLLENHRDVLVSIVRRRARARNLFGRTYDILSDACFYILSRSSTQKIDKPIAFFTRVAENVAIKIAKGIYIEIEEDVVDPELSPMEHALNRDESRKALNALDKLREIYRQAFLAKLSGKNFDEIGEELNISAATARQRVCRARVQLKELLGD